MDLQGSAQDVGSGGREHGSSTSEASTEQPGPGRHSQAVVSAARGPPCLFFFVAKTHTNKRRMPARKAVSTETIQGGP